MRASAIATQLVNPIDQWARGAMHAWDFTTDRARYNYLNYGAVMSTPTIVYTRADSQNAYVPTLLGGLQPFASGQMRRTGRGYLCEAAATNLLLWSSDWTNAAWTKSNMTTALTQTGPAGVANAATLLTASAGNATALQSITSASANRYGSVWMKRVTGSGNIDITLDGGTAWTTISSSINSATWTRVGKAQTSVTNPNFGIRIVTNADAVAVAFGQVESADFPTSPIPTTSASATRAVDALVANINAGLDYPMSYFAEIERVVDTGAIELYLGTNNGGATDRIELGLDASDRAFSLMSTSNVNQATVAVTGSIATGVITKIAARMATNDVQTCVNGSLATADTSATLPATPTKITFGSRNGQASPAYGFLRRCAIWNRALTDAQLQFITRV